MGELFKAGDAVRTLRSGQPCSIGKFLGAGGQGEVYLVEWGGAQFALKWFYAHTATDDQRASLERLVATRAPNERFLWPLDMAVTDHGAASRGFGYLMRLREKRFKGLNDLMAGRIDPTFKVLVTAGMQLVDSFYRLHSDGLCYRDINFGNAFFDPLTGDVLVCDNDNVAPNRSKEALVLGTPDFMAPEIVTGKALPSRQTDLFSLSVLLFYMLHIGHPLYGRRAFTIKCLDGPARTMLCGTKATFIFDPADKSNEAVSKLEDPSGECGGNALNYWSIYPQAVRDAFTHSFTTGIKDPEHGRLTEGAWRRVLAEARDAIFRCSCGVENFYDAAGSAAGGGGKRCWACGQTPVVPFRLRLERSTLVLATDAKLHPYHLGRDDSYDTTTTLGELVQNPNDARVWGLKNLSESKWVATLADGTTRDVDPGRSVPLAKDVRINFGTVAGSISY
jgi:DNA-binding helix-hairpin-helix protein with protein kinase domain